MSHFSRYSATEESGARILSFPVISPDLIPQQLEAFPYASPDNLILTFTHILELVVRIAGSLSQDSITTLLGEALTLEKLRLEPMQQQIERHKAFMSDLSCRQVRKRRRRQKRVKEDIELSA